MQRRSERGRPIYVEKLRSKQPIYGNIKEGWEDEVPEWQEADEISDYHTFVYPPLHCKEYLWAQTNYSKRLSPMEKGTTPKGLSE